MILNEFDLEPETTNFWYKDLESNWNHFKVPGRPGSAFTVFFSHKKRRCFGGSGGVPCPGLRGWAPGNGKGKSVRLGGSCREAFGCFSLKETYTMYISYIYTYIFCIYIYYLCKINNILLYILYTVYWSINVLNCVDLLYDQLALLLKEDQKMRCSDDDAWYQKIISKTKITLYVGTAYERKIHCPRNRKVQTCQFHRSASSRRASGNVFKSQRSRTRRFTLSLSRQPVTWHKKTS